MQYSDITSIAKKVHGYKKMLLESFSVLFIAAPQFCSIPLEQIIQFEYLNVLLNYIETFVRLIF